MRKCLTIASICWPLILCGQQLFFLDSLMLTSSNKIEERYNEWQEEKLNQVAGNKGISLGLGLTSVSAQEWGEGYGLRAGGKIDMLGGGWKHHDLEVKKLENLKLIQQLEGHQESLQHHYGWCYDYVTSVYHDQKIEVLDEIIENLEGLSTTLQDHYIHKRISYADLLKVKTSIKEYVLLKKTIEESKDIFKKRIDVDDMPSLHDHRLYELDIESLLDSVSRDSSYKNVVNLRSDNIELSYAQENLSDLSASLGYDVLRNRPYFSIQFSKNISKSSSSLVAAEKELMEERSHQYLFQKKKELLNLFIEYDYKRKQITRLNGNLEMVREKKRILMVTRALQELPLSTDEEELLVECLKIEFEIIDLKQQAMLLLLMIKRLTCTFNIGDFLLPADEYVNDKKFAGNRYLLLHDGITLPDGDRYFLEECEVIEISGNELMELRNLYPLDPDDYSNRSDLEKKIIGITEKDAKANILFTDIESLRRLELKSVRSQVVTYNK